MHNPLEVLNDVLNAENLSEAFYGTNLHDGELYVAYYALPQEQKAAFSKYFQTWYFTPEAMSDDEFIDFVIGAGFAYAEQETSEFCH